MNKKQFEIVKSVLLFVAALILFASGEPELGTGSLIASVI